MGKKYGHHKKEDAPSERIAEKVRTKKDAVSKKSNAGIAKNDKTEGIDADVKLVERDSIGIAVIAGLIIILLAGSIWGFMALQKQSDEIDSLKLNLANSGSSQYGAAQLSDETKQVQLYKDFVVLTNNVKKEVAALENYDIIYTDMHQLCSGFTERENSINHALYLFAEKEIVYFEQIAVLADKPECKPKIETLRAAMDASRVADEKLYLLSKSLCSETTDNIITKSAKSQIGWNTASADAIEKSEAFDTAENAVMECLA